MSAAFLLSFSVFETKDFHIGGNLGQVEDMQARWVQSAKGLEKDQTHLAGVISVAIQEVKTRDWWVRPGFV